MTSVKPIIVTLILTICAAIGANAQKMWINGRWVDLSDPQPTAASYTAKSRTAATADEIDWDAFYRRADSIDVSGITPRAGLVLPAIFDKYSIALMLAGDSIPMPPAPELLPGYAVTDPATEWIDHAVAANDRMKRLQMRYMLDNPRSVVYNSAFFGSAPKIYMTTFDPTTAQIQIKEVTDSLLADTDVTIAPPVIARRNWLHSFEGLVQFTQAYNSPNWYQGGNSNLNMLVNAVYSINLNPKFHPDLLFENTLQYKLVLTSAPEDDLRDYSINEDLLQFNTKFGVRAARRWFYSLSAQLKTQTLRNYISNTEELKAAFMSPGELNVGLGMTYNYANRKGTFTFDLTMAPVSYNLKTCLESKVDGTAFGIEPGHRTDNQFGANIEGKLTWKLAYNISLASRLYAFTDYGYVQGDLETTLSFSINRFLSTQLYAHLRYDSQTPALADTRWHKWQLKEIFSFGFAYKFANT